MKRTLFLFLFVLLLIPFGGLAQPCNSNTRPIPYAGVDTTICSSKNLVSLNGTVRRATGGQWSGGSGLFIPNNTSLQATYIPSWNEIQLGKVALILTTTGNGNCTAQRDTVYVTIRNLPNKTISGAVSICENTPGLPYSVTATTGNSYNWKVLGGTVVSGQNTNQIHVNWGSAGPGYIYMTETDNLGCEAIRSISPISHFQFSTNNLLKANLGPDALSVDADAVSYGRGFTIVNNCGGTKGLDLTLPGSTFNRGRLAMSFNWQRDEGQAIFFTRGNTEFLIDGGALRAKLEINNSSGTSVVGPISTGYTVPMDDIFRVFSFCFDSLTGQARVYVNDSLVWSYTTAPGTSLSWSSAGNAQLGAIMDGNCSQQELLDWADIGIPISIMPRPVASIYGPDSICRSETNQYFSDTLSNINYQWSSANATFNSGQNSQYTWLRWNQSGAVSLQLLLTNSTSGCTTSLERGFYVLPKPLTSPIQD